jgi:hypothetical protein
VGVTVGQHLGARLFSSQAYSWQVVTVSLVTQRIHNNVCLSRVIMNFQLLVFDQLEPPSLSLVQVRSSEDVLKAFVVCIDMNHIPK